MMPMIYQVFMDWPAIAAPQIACQRACVLIRAYAGPALPMTIPMLSKTVDASIKVPAAPPMSRSFHVIFIYYWSAGIRQVKIKARGTAESSPWSTPL